MNDRFHDAWEEFAAQDRARQAPPALERRVLEQVAEARVRAPSPSSVAQTDRRSAFYAACAIAAVLVAAVMLRQPSPGPPEVPPLVSRSFAPAPLQPAIGAHVPVLRPQIDRRRDAELMDWIAVYQDLPIVLMLDAAESAVEEPLQLVRLRLSMDALHVLGIATLGPDTGLVDVDLLVGEDGLPKTVRHVRLAQEDR